MCLIEEKSSIKPLASCAITLISGLQIFTNTEIVRKAREGVLEYLLINHPLDCPICDQGGECDLQDQTMVFGSDKGRFYDTKRSTSNKNLGFFVKTFLNRCIHCARCTRFLHDLAGTPELQLLGRGYKTEISNYVFKNLTSELSGNIIDLCPVGALTSKPYAFKARVWELMSFFSYDLMDAFCSNIQLDFRGLEFLRILPKTNKFLNDEWITDKTRFYYDSLMIQRLTSLFFKDLKYYPLSWNQGLSFFRNYSLRFFTFLKKTIRTNVFLTGYGTFLDLESSYFMKKFNSFFGINLYALFLKIKNIDFRAFYSLSFFWKLSNINYWSDVKFYLLNTNLRYESPITNLKLKKIINNYYSFVYIYGFLSNLNLPYTHLATKLSKAILNFLSFSQNFLLVKGWNTPDNFFSMQNANTVACTVSDITSSEFNLKLDKLNSSVLPIFFFNNGYSDKFKFSSYYPVLLNILHHVRNDFLQSINKKIKLLLFPTKFYIEKAASYISNTIFFFNTINPFSYSLRNTKEEWRIINSLLEHGFSYFFSSDIQKSINKVLPKIQKLLNFFSLNVTYFYTHNNLQKSEINNYFITNIITYFSNNLQLASRLFRCLNDYIYISFNQHQYA